MDPARFVDLEPLLFIGAFAAIVALALWQAAREDRRLRELYLRGSSATGTVTRLRTWTSKGRQRFVVQYEYPAGTGIQRGRASLEQGEFAALREGGPIELRYLPDQPAVSAPLSVAERRAAPR